MAPRWFLISRRDIQYGRLKHIKPSWNNTYEVGIKRYQAKRMKYANNFSWNRVSNNKFLHLFRCRAIQTLPTKVSRRGPTELLLAINHTKLEITCKYLKGWSEPCHMRPSHIRFSNFPGKIDHNHKGFVNNVRYFHIIIFIQVYYQYVIVIFCHKIYNHCFHLG